MYFVRLIFAQAMLSENILTSKYSQFTVILLLYNLCTAMYIVTRKALCSWAWSSFIYQNPLRLRLSLLYKESENRHHITATFFQAQCTPCILTIPCTPNQETKMLTDFSSCATGHMKEAKKGSQGVLKVMKFITCFQPQCTTHGNK